MTLKDFARNMLGDLREGHGDIYDSLDAGDHTQIIGCRQSGKSTILAIYMAHHLLFNQSESGSLIMVSSFSSYGGKDLIKMAVNYADEFVEKFEIFDRWGRKMEPVKQTTKLRATGMFPNEIEYFDKDRIDTFRGKGSIRAIIVDEFDRSWNIHKTYDAILLNAQVQSAQVVITGKRPKLKQDLDYNVYPLHFWTIPKFDAKEAFRAMNNNDREIHIEYERVVPFFDVG